MSSYLKALGLHAYLATTKKSYSDNGKYIEVKTQAIDAIRQTLSKENLSIASHCDSAFAAWNTLTSPELQRETMWRKNPWWMSPTKLAIWSKGLTPLRYIRILI